MNAQEIASLRQQVRSHIIVFAILVAGTLLSVGATSLIQSTTLKIGVALVIAATQASLVAGILMHLHAEGRTIRWTLILTAVFFVALIGLTLLANHDVPRLPGSSPETTSSPTTTPQPPKHVH